METPAGAWTVASRERLRARGFNLWGVTRVSDLDRCQCREARLGRVDGLSVIAVGVGGAGAEPSEDARTAMAAERAILEAEGVSSSVFFPDEPGAVDFHALAEAAGLAVFSPVVPFLLHPIYGPWFGLRAAMVVEEELEASGELAEFSPCAGCPATCLEACPVVEPGERLRLEACARHRHAGGCADRCELRLACRLGAEHAPTSERARAGYTIPLPVLRRHFGLGNWRFVPRVLRRRGSLPA